MNVSLDAFLLYLLRLFLTNYLYKRSLYFIKFYCFHSVESKVLVPPFEVEKKEIITLFIYYNFITFKINNKSVTFFVANTIMYKLIFIST